MEAKDKQLHLESFFPLTKDYDNFYYALEGYRLNVHPFKELPLYWNLMNSRSCLLKCCAFLNDARRIILGEKYDFNMTEDEFERYCQMVEEEARDKKRQSQNEVNKQQKQKL